MKLILVSLTISLFFTFISCTKSNNITTTIRDTTTLIYRDTVYIKKPLNPIVGLWVGKYLNSGDVDSFYYSINIQPTGYCIATSIANNNAASTAGPWQLSGTAFTATVKELITSPTKVQDITAAYDSTAGTLTGQWTVTQGIGNPTGTFKLIRVQ